MISPQDVQEIRERIDLVEIISSHTKLKKAGRIFKGLCCFHQEKTPSFTVDPAKQLYHCFGCGVGGDVFSFVQQIEGLTFNETAEKLASRAGIVLEQSSGEVGHRKPLIEVMRVTAEYFADLLTNAPEATAARRYLEGRGFNQEDAKHWGLGFSPPGKDTLYRYLLNKKFSSKQIVDAGLALVTDSGEHKDRFRGRVIFPVSDVSGQVVGFGARALGAEQPKYLNSPETPIYRKARILFGLDRAKSAMVGTGTAVVTEGYTDVIALQKVGIANAVATCGTALGEDHFALVKRFCERVILAFDADAAGAVASERGFGLHSKIGLEVLVAPIPAGKDPADVALAEGEEAVKLIFEQAVPLMRFVLEREIDRHRIDTPEGKAKAVRAAVELLSWEPSRVARSEHGFWVARRIGVDPQEVQLELAESRHTEASPSTPARITRQPGHVRVEREALAILFDSPSHLKQAAEWLHEDHFTLPEHRVLLACLLESVRDPGRGAVMDRLPDDDSRRLAAELALTPITTSENEEVFLRLEEFRLKRQIDTLRATLERLDAKVDATEYDSVFEELMRLDLERRRFDER